MKTVKKSKALTVSGLFGERDKIDRLPGQVPIDGNVHFDQVMPEPAKPQEKKA